jgi:hypothetical protein
MLNEVQQLALGIGSPKTLDKSALGDFFRIVNPVEADVLRSDLRSLRKRADLYSRNAGITEHLQNAKRMTQTKQVTSQDVMSFLSAQTREYHKSARQNEELLHALLSENEFLRSCVRSPAKKTDFSRAKLALVPIGLAALAGLIYTNKPPPKAKQQNPSELKSDTKLTRNDESSLFRSEDLPLIIPHPVSAPKEARLPSDTKLVRNELGLLKREDLPPMVPYPVPAPKEVRPISSIPTPFNQPSIPKETRTQTFKDIKKEETTQNSIFEQKAR